VSPSSIFEIVKWRVTAVVWTVAAVLVAAVAPNGRELTPDPTAVASSTHEPPRGLLPSYSHGKRISSLRDVLAVGVVPLEWGPHAGHFALIEQKVDCATPHVATLGIAIRAPPHA
jgi:hypothetical protein